MPVTIEKVSASPEPRVTDLRERRRRRGVIANRGRRLSIGLLNNMPDGALYATERQFRDLLDKASDGVEVRLRFYALRDVPRSKDALNHLIECYTQADALRGQSLDALIVTGAQPIEADLMAEPYWRGLTQAIDWAEANTVSTILSCLAAHAGVLHFSGVARRPLPRKCSGVFAFDRLHDNPLTEGAQTPWRIPHSRHNGLDDAELERNGYTVLTRSATTGVDMFVRQMRSLMVFLQGHPEYERETLAREYRRDMSRFLSGESVSLPDAPRGYFSVETERAFERFAALARANRRVETMVSFPNFEFAVDDAPWRSSATLLYRNWLGLIADRKVAAVGDRSKQIARRGG